MKQFISFFAVVPIVIVLLTSCNSIDNADLSMGSIIERQRAVQTHDDNVSLTEANGIADRFFSSNVGSTGLSTKSDDSRSNLISTAETVREDGQDLMYVFNYEDGGFVIVGSTRNYYPILAYSDEGTFVLQEDMGPVDVWLDETKVCIKNSSSLSAEKKAEMQQLWARYDGSYQEPSYSEFAARRPQTRSTGEDACWDRIDELQALYGSQGWTFLPLSFVEDVFDDAGLSTYYDDICYSATQNHSALNETIIGYKTPVFYQSGQSGRLLETTWFGSEPLNSFCPLGANAGCGPVAVAQVMKYYELPTEMDFFGMPLTWDNIPVDPFLDSLNQLARLMRYTGNLVQATYSPSGAGATTTTKITNGLNSLDNYSASNADHNNLTISAVRNNLIVDNKPVIMFGSDSSSPQDPGHFWVCEGAKETIYNQIMFYTENQPNGAGTFTQGMYSQSSPGIVGGGDSYLQFYMNWGWGPSPASAPLNGWFLSNNVSVDGHNYQYLRKDIFITAHP